MKKFVNCVILFGILATLVGCSQEVGSGEIGRVKTRAGWNQNILEPGRHSCWGFDKLYVIESFDDTKAIHMNVLCQDQMNFSCDLEVRYTVDRSNTKGLQDAFDRLKADGNGTIRRIPIHRVWDVYVKQTVSSIANETINNYRTVDIVNNIEAIREEIQLKTSEALKNNAGKVLMISMSNVDYPDIITKARERAKEREIEIEMERSEQQKRLLQAQNRRAIAEIEYKIKLLEAAAVRDYNMIIGSSITPGFLKYHHIKVISEAARGPNNWGFVVPSDPGDFDYDPDKLILDERLMNKLKEMREAAEDTNTQLVDESEDE